MSQPIKVAVAGGSLAGLMTGIEIRFAGAEVEIHERSAGILDEILIVLLARGNSHN